MVLVDTSVVNDFVRSGDSATRALFVSLPAGNCGITCAEVLYGAQDEAEVADLLDVLDCFVKASIDENHWTQTGIHLSRLRRSGLRLPLADVAIATLAIELDVELWTRDRHFTQMQSMQTSLRLFSAPAPSA